MGVLCSCFGHAWETIHTEDQTVLKFSPLDMKTQRKAPGVLVIEECRRCGIRHAYHADTVGNKSTVDVNAAVHTMNQTKKFDTVKKRIPVTVHKNQIGFSTKDLRLRSEDLEALVYEDRIEIRIGPKK